MGVVIESEVWEPNPFCYVFLAFACFSSIFLFPHFAGSIRTKSQGGLSPLDSGAGVPFARFQRTFLLVYSLASLTDGLESVFGEFEFLDYGIARSQVVLYLSAGVAASLLVGTFMGMVSDIMGPSKFCILFCIIHLVISALRSVTRSPNGWITSICFSLASSLLSFSFETWMVVEHEKQSHRKDLLTDTFWLMTYFGSAVLVGSQVLANLLSSDIHKGILGPSAAIALLSLLSILYIEKEWKGYQPSLYSVKTYVNLFHEHVLQDRRTWLLMSAQACFHLSDSIFWILWAPTIVADGREVRLSFLYPCFVGSRMLGSTSIPWFSMAASSLFNKDHQMIAFTVAGFCLSVVAYDYQEISVLVILFCIYNICAGLISPSLAHLRSMYVPLELRGGMISISLAPANIILLFFLIQGGYHRSISNSAILAISALSLFCGAGCLRTLNKWKRQSRQNWHHL